jgi:hypothetical protein
MRPTIDMASSRIQKLGETKCLISFNQIFAPSCHTASYLKNTAYTFDTLPPVLLFIQSQPHSLQSRNLTRASQRTHVSSRLKPPNSSTSGQSVNSISLCAPKNKQMPEIWRRSSRPWYTEFPYELNELYPPSPEPPY